MKKLLLMLALFASSMAFSQCPTFVVEQSNEFYLLFTSSQEIEIDNNIIVNGLSFVEAGEWESNGTYYYSITNTSGQALDLTNFTIEFEGGTCVYPDNTLSSNDFELDVKNIPLGEQFYVISIDGKLLYKGITDNNTYLQLPREKFLGLIVGKYKIKKLYKA